MRVTGLQPGKLVGEIQKKAEAQMLDFGIKPDDAVQIENLIKDAYAEIGK